MVKDAQVKGLKRLMSSGTPLCTASMKAGMSENTARKYSRSAGLPSEMCTPHSWRTRPDPFASLWSTEIEPLLADNPGLEAKALFENLQERYPGIYGEGQLRTLQRRFRHWRGLHGEPREVFFPQRHYPGILAASDFTSMNELGIMIESQPFKHLLYHFVLTYSNWEDGMVCFSESFESLSEGFQNALWKLNAAPARHRTDCLTAAVNNLKEPREFTKKYAALLSHYGMEAQRTNPNSGNENGDIEQRHNRLKRAVVQALILRGSRDFASRGEYERFLCELFSRVNRGRQGRLDEEKSCMHALPPLRLPVYTPLCGIPVSNASTIRVRLNTYSVHSRLIGEYVDVRLYAEHIDVYYNRTFVESLERLPGRGRHRIDYRHIIDWLVRKPGAFSNYRYQADLFPHSNFRIAYDMLREQDPRYAVREYVSLLHCAAKESEELTIKALEILLGEGTIAKREKVEALVSWLKNQQILPAPEGAVKDVELSDYDELLGGEGVAQ
jgi:hypothetical protein